jgi:ATP-dependent RNA helicase SUPV3L1/SUV3
LSVSPFDIVNFKELKEYLPGAREGLAKGSTTGTDLELRSVEDASKILHLIEMLSDTIKTFMGSNPQLQVILEQEWGTLEDFQDREAIIETCFIDDFIFPEFDRLPLPKNSITSEQMTAHLNEFRLSLETMAAQHVKSQDLIRDNFTLELKMVELPCQCVYCLGDFRAKIREHVFKTGLRLVDEGVTWLWEHATKAPVDEIRTRISGIQNELDKLVHHARFKLKHASLNKLEKQIKDYFRSQFTCKNETVRSFADRLIPSLQGALVDRGVSADLLGSAEYERFFLQMGTGIFRNESFLQREFGLVVRSILLLKRQDISSSILQDYLGQFWLHANARRINREIIYHMGPTNSGKTYAAVQRLCEVKKGCYLAPLRLLASELYDTMNAKGVITTLLTGEEVIEIPGATHTSSTVEMAKFHETFDCVVIDEIQMMADPQRGWAWTRALINMCTPEIHICGDATALELVKAIVKLTGDSLSIRQYERLAELGVDPRPVTLGELTQHDALIVFSRREALNYKRDLEDLGFKVSIVYGRLGPEVRREQARKFDVSETDIIVSTDAIAMGMNLPIKRIVFAALAKNIDSKEYLISDSEIKQIAGRCGRYKRFPKGHVTCLTRVDNGIARIMEAVESELDQKDKAMVGPDLEIFSSVNAALSKHGLQVLSLVEFLRLFNTMEFSSPFYCVDLSEMIEIAQMIENADKDHALSTAEIFGFACAPVNLGLMEHVQFFVWILGHFVKNLPVKCDEIDPAADNIDYLETSIKCVELYQWLARHFNGKNFSFDVSKLLHNKALAIDKLNDLLSHRLIRYCSSCGTKLADTAKYNICEGCFQKRRFPRHPRRPGGSTTHAPPQGGAHPERKTAGVGSHKPRRHHGRGRSARGHSR